MNKSGVGVKRKNNITKHFNSPVVLNTRSSKRKTENAEGEQETAHLEDPRRLNEQLLTEKGLTTNRQLLGGPVTNQSGCLSSSKTLLRENSSSATQGTTEELQSIPVTSRSKRLRGATTSTLYNKIAYTDRKTRSSSNCSLESNTNNYDKDSVCKSEYYIESNHNSESKIVASESESTNFSGESKLKFEEKRNVVTNCFDSQEEIHSSEGNEKEVFSSLAEIKKTELKLKEKDNKLGESTKNLPNANYKSTHAPLSENEYSSTNGTGKVIKDEREKNRGNFLGCETKGINRSKVINESKSKSNSAPMLLMNNLPYMGELTFDTRPRRGRKPKKADICHLISKNYGIHFPNSYANEPNTGSTPVPSVTYSAKKPPSRPNKLSSTSSKVGKKHSAKSLPTSTVSSWEISPPDLLPISISGRNFTSTSTTSISNSSRMRIVSSNKIDTKSSHMSSLYSTTKSFKNKSIIPKDTQTNNVNRNSGCESAVKSGSQDEPLNLCMRDTSTSQIASQIRQSLSNFNSTYAEAMNMKLPLISPASFFSDFQLNPTGVNRQSSKGSQESKKFKISNNIRNNNKVVNAKAKSVNDPSLVNNVNLLLSLSSDALGQKSNKSKGKLSQGLKFAPPITTDDPGFKRLHPNKKTKRRLSPNAIKSDDSDQSDLKPNVSSSSGLFLNTSSVHPPSTSMNSLDSHTGGCLFGQPDSGPTSGAQVSICKFKFTGGAKPSLQEKKMLSVDSGGNFRFYTDKSGSSSVKSLKTSQSGNTPSTTFQTNFGESFGDQDCQYAFSSLPKSAKSMSVCMPMRPSSLKIPSSCSSKVTPLPSSSKGAEIQKSPSSSIPLSPAARELNNLRLDSNSQLLSPTGDSITFPHSFQQLEDGYSSSHSDNSSTGTFTMSHPQSGFGSNEQYSHGESSSKSNKMRLKRKRRTRKSLMREKLEKTFKEKGFLIQTQQLESAEGATYCKFRQLRKFTRYLFRSWKDYLPDNVKEINNTGANEEVGPSNLTTNTAGGRDGERRGGFGESGMEMELDLTTTNTSNQDHNDSREHSDVDDNEDSEGTDSVDHLPAIFTPQITLTNPDYPDPNDPVDFNPSSINNHTDNDSDSSNVDVENIDGTSDNSSPRYNPNINNNNQENNDNDVLPDKDDDATDNA